MKARVVDSWYTVAEEGYKQRHPIVHLIVRDTSWERHHVEVDQFPPYFCVPTYEWDIVGEELEDDERVVGVTREDRRGRKEVDLWGEDLVRIEVREPSDVGDLRELFEDPKEADVLYPTRFLVDVQAKQWIELPEEAREERISAEEVSIGIDEPPETVPPLRTCVFDIEVEQSSDGPPVVSKEGTERARNDVTAITAHDGYTDEYKVWLLAHPSWDAEDSKKARESVDAEVSVYANPSNVVGKFFEWVIERDFDVLTGWNSSSFDVPYVINWAINNDLTTVYKLSPTRDVREMNGDGQWIDSSLKGRLLVDLMEMWEKTNVHEADSKRLEDVAEAEDVSVGKLAIEDAINVPRDEPAIDYAWEHHPDVFAEYSVRDVKAAVAINRESKENTTIL